nr:uncharacterized protein LOC106688442 [Halyomorpha halys]
MHNHCSVNRLGLSVEEAKERLKKMILSIEANGNDLVKAIYNETDLECTLQKKSSVIGPKMLIDKEDKKRRKKKLLEIIVEINKYKNGCHFYELQALEDLIKDIKKDALKRIAVALLRKKHYEHYRAILGALLLQSMCRILENKFIVRIREHDLVIILSIKKRVIEQYEHITNLRSEIYIDKRFLDEHEVGGLIVFNKPRTVYVDDSIYKRCDLVIDYVRPFIRSLLKKKKINLEELDLHLEEK